MTRYGMGRVVADGPRLRDVAARLVDALYHGEGLSVSPRTGDLAPEYGYMVGKACDVDGWIFGDASFSGRHKDEVVNLMAAHLEKIPHWVLRETYTYIGVWIDIETDKVWLDVSGYHLDRYEAIKLGRERGELAIWSLHENDEIRL